MKHNGIKTKSGKEITHKDLRYAVQVMEKKHKNCRWKSTKVKSKNFYIIIEGYYWLEFVYFNTEKKLIDADIDFFEERIEQYEKLLKLDHKELFEKNMTIQELVNFFSKKCETIEKAMWKMIKVHSNYRYIKNNEYVIIKEGVKWLSKNCFKSKYLELLEKRKMDLTEEYIKAGYIYDNFFEKN